METLKRQYSERRRLVEDDLVREAMYIKEMEAKLQDLQHRRLTAEGRARRRPLGQQPYAVSNQNAGEDHDDEEEGLDGRGPASYLAPRPAAHENGDLYHNGHGSGANMHAFWRPEDEHDDDDAPGLHQRKVRDCQNDGLLPMGCF